MRFNATDSGDAVSDRDDKGRFQKGHGLRGPGRPALTAELPFIDGVKSAGSAEQVARVIEKLADLAIKGNVQAAGLYLAYVIGKPQDHLDVTSGGNSLASDEWLMLRNAILEALTPYPEARRAAAQALLKADHDAGD